MLKQPAKNKHARTHTQTNDTSVQILYQTCHRNVIYGNNLIEKKETEIPEKSSMFMQYGAVLLLSFLFFLLPLHVVVVVVVITYIIH